MIPLYSVYNSAECEAAALQAMRSGQLASGPAVEQFRQGIGGIVGHDRVVTTNDMSSAMQVALRLAGVGPGSEVLTSPFSCMATNSPIVHAGATPVWIDIDPASAAPRAGAVAAAITARTKALILYHFAGFPVWSEEIATLCRSRGIALIEDCDNALGATIDGQMVGSLGDFAVFSFSPIRQISCIEGGALACRQEQDHARAARLKRFGYHPVNFRDQTGEISEVEDVAEIGWSAALNNLGSAVGAAQLSSWPVRLAAVRANAQRLIAGIATCDGIAPMTALAKAAPAYWVLPLRTRRRDALLAHLKASGIAASKVHYRNDRYSGFPVTQSVLPGVTEFAETMLAIPCGWWLDTAQLDYIIETLHAFCATSA